MDIFLVYYYLKWFYSFLPRESISLNSPERYFPRSLQTLHSGGVRIILQAVGGFPTVLPKLPFWDSAQPATDTYIGSSVRGASWYRWSPWLGPETESQRVENDKAYLFLTCYFKTPYIAEKQITTVWSQWGPVRKQVLLPHCWLNWVVQLNVIKYGLPITTEFFSNWTCTFPVKMLHFRLSIVNLHFPFKYKAGNCVIFNCSSL